MNNPINAAKEWFFSIALKKAAVKVAQAGAALIVGNLAPGLAKYVGITIDVDPNALAAGLLAGSEMLRNWLKQKYPNGVGKAL